MLTMDQISDIRYRYFEEGHNISEIAGEMHLNWKTVQKYIDQQDFSKEEKPKQEKDSFPKLTPYKATIDEWLESDRHAPRKQRHTAKRVHKRLKDECPGFDVSYRLVADYVAKKKKELRLKNTKTYIPLEHYAGEAQADFGEADFYENGRKRTGKYFVLSFPYSNQGYLQLHYGENMECLLESMKAIFEHIGGVPREIWFDNTSTIVTEIIQGGGRKTTEKFQRFQEHYGFKPVFMNPASGWEKGSVENKVGYDRRNLLVPVPSFHDLDTYNHELLERCDLDGNRDHYRYNETITERFEKDRHALYPLPSVSFDTAKYEQLKTNNCGKFTLENGCHEYSASPALADKDVWLKITSSTVTVMDLNQNIITVHRRLYGKEKQQSMDWIPYLKYIAHRPRSLRNSGIYEMLPVSVQKYMDDCPNSERGKALRILSDLTERSCFADAVQAVEKAVSLHAADSDSLDTLYKRLFSDLPQMPVYIPDSSVPILTPTAPDLSAYDAVLQKGGDSNG